ncbi:MAG: sterol-binding protein [endosymbiont of Galathealinum brachiosum]|uniref:Ubiquinone biosynthesis accessory factor UbiJ n=1 Tax=endosymbiont of Galathealinum brachiosum TaxID=2200906 RepID=A0A370DCH8_9GAMM|nr:MAG: sterol-binding protein [endosymbiont of Galathealinum brachiosum]
MDLDQALTAAIETALNRYLSLDPDALSRFSSLEGKIIAIEIKDLNKTLSLFPSADDFMILADFDGEADATISGTPIALAKMGLAKDPKDLLFTGEITITGDTSLANQFNRLLSQLDIDWEEILAQNIGDIAAHKIGTVSHGINQWFKRSTNSVFMDAGEYLQEEIHLSPSSAELRKFIKQVDDLREATDRLAMRIKLLKK